MRGLYETKVLFRIGNKSSIGITVSRPLFLSFRLSSFIWVFDGSVSNDRSIDRNHRSRERRLDRSVLERMGDRRFHHPFLLSNQVRNGCRCLWIFVYDSMQEFLFDSERSRICCRCWSWAGDGTWALLLREFKCWGGGNDCLRRRLNAGLRLYFSLAWIKSSLNTCEMFKFSFADTSTKPFSHFIVTNSLVLSVSTCKCTFE